jgi:hypothetical protein
MRWRLIKLSLSSVAFGWALAFAIASNHEGNTSGVIICIIAALTQVPFILRGLTDD